MLLNAILDPSGEITYSDHRKFDSITGPGIFRAPDGLIVPLMSLSGKRACGYKQTDLDPVLTCGRMN